MREKLMRGALALGIAVMAALVYVTGQLSVQFHRYSLQMNELNGKATVIEHQLQSETVTPTVVVSVTPTPKMSSLKK